MSLAQGIEKMKSQSEETCCNIFRVVYWLFDDLTESVAYLRGRHYPTEKIKTLIYHSDTGKPTGQIISVAVLDVI